MKTSLPPLFLNFMATCELLRSIKLIKEKEKVKVKVIKSDTSIIKRLKKKIVKFQALADKIWIRNCLIEFYRFGSSYRELIQLLE